MWLGAAYTRANPSDRSAFDAHYERVRNDPSATLLAIDDDAEFVGTIGSFTMEGEQEISYWIAPCDTRVRQGSRRRRSGFRFSSRECRSRTARRDRLGSTNAALRRPQGRSTGP